MNARRLATAARIVTAAYFLHVAAPHFALLHHAHPGGEAVHDHGFAGVRDAQDGAGRTGRVDGSGATTLVQGPALPPGFEEPDPGVAPTAGVHDHVARGAGEQGLQTPASVLHSHVVQDPNLLAIAGERCPPAPTRAATPPRERPAIAAGVAPARTASARAPPAAA